MTAHASTVTQTMTETGFETGTGQVRRFMEHHYLHFNARETVAAARGYEAHIDAGGKMLVTLAGAMSTARMGRILGRMIRAGKVHAISCTGANLEEDIFTLLSANEYEHCPNWRALSAEDEKALYDRGMNRVTDTCIPETIMRHVESRLYDLWDKALKDGTRKFPFQYYWEVLGQPDLAQHYQAPPEDSWMLAAKEMNIPIVTPGWEDSTLGNMFTGWAIKRKLDDHRVVRFGTEAMAFLAHWYKDHCNTPGTGKPSVGFFQIGGGIAGDFPICAVPMMIQDLEWEDTPFWGYFCQISDAETSFGGYSGAVPNEKITWGKLDVDTPKFMIASDATIVAPLIFAYVLGD
jgi:deoxyhypusine synthase